MIRYSRGIKVAKASVVNILEHHVQDLALKSDGDAISMDLTFTAFEVKTVKVELA
jgi:hypothetical protein